MSLACLIVLSAPLWLRALPQGAGSGQHTPSKSDSLAPAFQEAVRLRNGGQFASAKSAFETAARLAHELGDHKTEARARLDVGGCQLRLFEYREAVATYAEVHRLASDFGYSRLAGAALFDISSVYLQLHNLEVARAHAIAAKASFEKAHVPGLLAKALIQIAALETETGHRKKAEAAYQQAISICRRTNDFRTESLAEDHLGEALIGVHDLPGAEQALTNAYRIRLLHHDELLPITQAKLAILAGVGLTGLSRAWLFSGASAVVVSAWPTADDAGSFFSSFYRHLTSAGHSAVPLPERAAAALANAQLDMQATSDYRRSPSFWAAYSVISKE